jgi:hypothetical protein
MTTTDHNVSRNGQVLFRVARNAIGNSKETRYLLQVKPRQPVPESLSSYTFAIHFSRPIPRRKSTGLLKDARYGHYDDYARTGNSRSLFRL